MFSFFFKFNRNIKILYQFPYILYSTTVSNNCVSTSLMKNCNNFSTTLCSFLNKKNTLKKVFIGNSLISVWICWPALNSLKRFEKAIRYLQMSLCVPDRFIWSMYSLVSVCYGWFFENEKKKKNTRDTVMEKSKVLLCRWFNERIWPCINQTFVAVETVSYVYYTFHLVYKNSSSVV